MSTAITTQDRVGCVQHDLVRRALDGKFLMLPHEVTDATKGELRRLVLDGKLVFANGGWTAP